LSVWTKLLKTDKIVCNFTSFCSHNCISYCHWLSQQHIFPNNWLKAFHKLIQRDFISYPSTKLQHKMPMRSCIALNSTTLYKSVKLVLQTPLPIYISKLFIQFVKKVVKFQTIQISSSSSRPIHPKN
jgi:hypothetical protein